MIEKSVGEASELTSLVGRVLGGENILEGEGCASSVPIAIASIAAIHIIFSKPNIECTELCEGAILFDESELGGGSTAMWRMGVPHVNYRAPIFRRIPVQKSRPGEGIPKTGHAIRPVKPPSRLLKNSMSTVEGGRIGDGKPSSASYGSFLGHPDAIDFSRFRICRVFQQPANAVTSS